jgi:polyisoprenoid-binding protein YceI
MKKTSTSLISRKRSAIFWICLGLCLTACSGGATQAATSAPPTSIPPTPTQPAPSATLLPAAPPTQADPGATPAAPTETASPAADDRLRLVLAAEGNEARYVVTEQLAGFSFPSDAVGVTSAISGALVLTADGKVVSEESKFVVDLTTLTSDSGMRDNFIQRNTLETNRFPTAEFVPTEAAGLPSPLPASGEVTFQLSGELTIHGVTRPATWEVTAQVVGQELVGRASTRFTFGDFGMTIPQVARVLSIEDNIRLEYDFRLVLASGSP